MSPESTKLKKMVQTHLHMVHTAILAIVCCGTTTAKTPSMPMELTSSTGIGIKAQLHDSYVHNNMAAILHDNRWQPVQRQMQPKQLQRYVTKLSTAAREPATKRRSYSSNSDASAGGYGSVNGGIAAALNGLSNLSGLGHISNGYGAVAPTHTEALAVASTKQEIPIYEEQNEDAALATAANDYANAAGVSNYGRENNQQHSSAGPHTAIYNLPAAAMHHNDGFLPTYGNGEDHSAWMAKTPQHESSGHSEGEHNFAYDKISVGNFMHHYDLNSGYGEEHHQQQQIEKSHEEQQQQQLQHYESEHAAYLTPQLHGHAGHEESSGPSDYQQHDDGEPNFNYLPESNGQGHTQQSHHTDIINYVPVPVVKKQHVPYEKAVQIPVSHAVIVPVRKPVPIHIPVTKQVQVGVEKELKIPVERVVPYPVERPVPYPVEKRVAVPVFKFVPVKVPKPFPVKVPVFKTVLHKVKSWW